MAVLSENKIAIIRMDLDLLRKTNLTGTVSGILTAKSYSYWCDTIAVERWKIPDLLDTIEDRDKTIKYLNNAFKSLKREINALRKEE